MKNNNTPNNWSFSNVEKTRLQAIYLLESMVLESFTFPNVLPMNLRAIEPAIDLLEAYKFIQQTESFENEDTTPNWIFKATKNGRKFISTIKRYYSNFISIFDVFAHVDDEEGIFGMEEMTKIILLHSETKYQEYLDQDIWGDFRVPVMVFKGINPKPFVFLSMTNESEIKIDPKDSSYSWAEKIDSNSFWDKLENILDSAPKWEELGYQDIGPKKIIKNIIRGGFHVIQAQFEYLEQHAKEQNSIINAEIPGPSEDITHPFFKVKDDDYMIPFYEKPIKFNGDFEEFVLDKSYWDKFLEDGTGV